ncbi:MAG: pseudaminic acid cytidylyltransferase [Lachnospiraceae bacterium]|nr:pseudaminic acid cytidylyltransferase [Lachnospiraceae bacterium]
MKRIAIITARGGSKRIPHKNIRDFCGKPILFYSIEAALKSHCFTTVMVSTDDEIIADLAKKAGAEVPFLRSDKTSGDFATTAEVIEEVLTEYKKQGEEFDTACCIYPTAPFITAEKLQEAVRLLEEKDLDSVMPVVEFSFPPLRGMVMEEGKLKYKWEEYSQMRSQDLEKIYHDVGQFYVLNVKHFEESKKLVTQNTGAIMMSELETQDIDNETDWKIAELKYRLIHE